MKFSIFRKPAALAALVQRIGHTAVLYRPSTEHRQIVLPRP